MRRFVAASASLLVVAALCVSGSAVASAAPSVAAGLVVPGDWSAMDADAAGTSGIAAGTGITPANIASLSQSWVSPSATPYRFLQAGGLVIFFFVDSVNSGIRAVSAKTGAVVWSRNLVGPGMVADGSTLFVSSNRVTPGIGAIAGVEALNLATGVTKWYTAGPVSAAYYQRGQMAVGQGSVFASLSLGNNDYIIALDEATGRIRWISAPSYGGGVSYSGGHLFAPGSNGGFTVFDAATGHGLWKGEATDDLWAPTIIDNMVISGGGSEQDSISGTPATGCAQTALGYACPATWTVSVPGPVVALAASGTTAVAAVDHGNLSYLQAIDVRTGALLWGAPNPRDFPAVAIAGSFVYVVGGTGGLDDTITAWPLAGCGTALCSTPAWTYQVPVNDRGDESALVIAHGQLYLCLNGALQRLALTPGTVIPVSARRLLDTRSGFGAASAGSVGARRALALPVAGRGGVPTSGVSAVVLNLTVTSPQTGGYLTAWADGTSRPGTSNLNFGPRQTISNTVIAPVGIDGKVALFNGSFGAIQLVADVTGYVQSGTVTTPGGISTLTPSRLLDTRTGLGSAAPLPIGPGRTLALAVTGRAGVPTSGVSAVILTVTAATPRAAGYITAWADGTTRPGTSNLNFSKTDTIATTVIAPVGTDGKVDLYNGAPTATHLVVDVSGYIHSGTVTNPDALTIVAPTRVLDTRTGLGTTGPSAIAPNTVVSLAVAGRGGVPSSATAVILTVTATSPTRNGYVTAWADGTVRPATSSLNFTTAQTIANTIIVPIGPNGHINFVNGSNGTVNLLADVTGYL